MSLILGGLRIAAGIPPVGAVAAKIVAGSARRRLRTCLPHHRIKNIASTFPRLFAALLLLSAAGIAIFPSSIC
jgi:ABC-type nitrate/sulfonate/bicarbonate transport system permease component